MDGISLVNLGNLTKPATLLVEKISDAVGGLYRPTQIRRVAQAEADARLIYADRDIKISDLQRRAALRWIEEETQHQLHMEEIIRKALPLVAEDASPQDMDNDWITNFFAKCRQISDSDMQELWSRILAGEANMPGSFSRQTINLVENLGSRESTLFTNLCRFAWDMKGVGEHSVRCPVIFTTGTVEPIYTQHNITFDSINHLSELGLVRVGEHGYQVHYRLGHGHGKRSSRIIASYFGRPISLQIKDFITIPTLFIGSAAFTHCGTELSLVSRPTEVEGFYNYVHGWWDRQGGIDRIATSSQDARPEVLQHLEAIEIRAAPGMVRG